VFCFTSGRSLVTALLGVLLILPAARAQEAEPAWPSDGPAGWLGGGWQAAGPASYDPTTFGIDSRPIGPFAAVTLADGRPAVIYEAVRGAALDEATRVLRVRALVDGRWVDVADPLLLGELEPAEVRERRWGSQVYLVGPRRFDQIEARPAPEGGLEIVALEAEPRDEFGHVLPHERVIHRHLWRDGAWQEHRSFELRMPGEPLGDVAGPRIELSSHGSLYFHEGRRIAGRATACVRRREGDRWAAMDYEAPGDGRGVSGMRDLRLFVEAAQPLLATLGQQVHQGRIIHGDIVLRWTGTRWRPLFDDPQVQAKARRYGMPIGQRPDGMPVWVHTATVGRSRSNPLGEQVRFVEPADDGRFIEQRLPGFAVRATMRLEATPELWYAGGRPMLAFAGLAATDDRRRDGPLNRLCVAVFERVGGRWHNLGRGESPAYSRPLHGSTDRIFRAVARPGAAATLLLWQGPAPIGGPTTLYAAHYPRPFAEADGPGADAASRASRR